MPWTPPESAKTFGFRPLDKGVILSQSSQTLPDGAFVQLDNIIANKEGPRRRPGFEEFAGGATTPYRCIDILTALASDGSLVTFLLTNKVLYTVNARTGLTEIAWAYDTGTITVSGATVTGTGTAWTTNDIQPGDLIRVGTEETEIIEVSGAGTITIESGGLTDGAGLSYSIQRTFSPGTLNAPTWAKTPSGLAIADGKHQLLKVDLIALTIDYWTTNAGKQPPNGAVIPAVVGYFSDRVYQGNVIDPVDGTQRARILWSTLADETDFSFPENYTDLPYSGGSLLRIIGLNKYLMVYFDDAIYTGYPTNYPTLPFRFERKETGGIGLGGVRAVTAYLGGHFFIGQNDFYFTDGDQLKGIGDPIAKDLMQTLEYPEWSYCCPDPLNFNILFGVSGTSAKIERIWRWDYRSNSWSRDPISTEMLSNPRVNSALTWDELTGTWDTLGTTYSSWDTIRVRDSQRRVIIENAGAIWRGSLDGRLDFGNAPVQVEIVTKDHDFDDPDGLKVFTRFGLKIDSYTLLTNTLTFNVYVSKDRGRTYKSAGILTIPIGKDEGYVNFRATGSTLRIRLTSTSEVLSYYIAEYTLRAIGFGEELDTSTH